MKSQEERSRQFRHIGQGWEHLSAMLFVVLAMPNNLIATDTDYEVMLVMFARLDRLLSSKTLKD
ncbi:MAG: hypothetical protein AAGD25_07350 [Cyanobacteria bacterium P01_F01_bin.150]